jgi:hypothetical protein
MRTVSSIAIFGLLVHAIACTGEGSIRETVSVLWIPATSCALRFVAEA